MPETIVNQKPLTAFRLKLIALTTMVIDHVAAVLPFPSAIDSLLRSIGRIAFPIYAFFIAEGCRYTRSREKYLLRLGLFGLISQLPFVSAFYVRMWEPDRWWARFLAPGNVFYTMFFAVACIHIWETLRRRSRIIQLAASGIFVGCFILWACMLFFIVQSAWPFIFMIIAYVAAFLAACHFLGWCGGENAPDWLANILAALPLLPVFFLAEVLDCDYGVFGVALICLIYLARSRKLQIAILALGMVYEYGLAPGLRFMELAAHGVTGVFSFHDVLAFGFALVAVVLLCLYNGQRGKNVKWAFYAAYPVHIAILAILVAALGL